jgi:GTP-dependent phosphoenolpyruvate carboxykinase
MWRFAHQRADAQATETPVGLVPSIGDGGIAVEGLDQVKGHFARFGDNLPAEFTRQMESFERRLGG